MPDMRLGVLGGTFDPIHYGHLFIAEQARVQFKLDRVLVIPNGKPPHRADYLVSAPGHRLAMASLAAEPNPFFECLSLEVDRPGPSYTVDTLADLGKRYPGAELFLIAGADAIAEIDSWKTPGEVVASATLIAAPRGGLDAAALRARLPAPYARRTRTLGGAILNVAATDIRRRLTSGQSARYLTPDSVLDYIARHKLYLASDGQA